MASEVDPHEETSAEPTRGPAPREALAGGGTIGGYELRAVLGEGGMGVVWRAHDAKLDREIAIKVLKRGDAPASLRQRFQREARAMARLKHPNVLTVYDSGTEGDRDFIAMELVDGSSLDVWLAEQPEHHAVVATMLAAGRGLAAAHRAGLVHRDFKPHNILRSHDGRVMVTDFGLARGLGDELAPELEETLDASPRTPAPKTDSVLDSPLTQTGALIGTPAYMAPEQFRGAPPDPRTDQFAFCVTAWQMLTGGRPYHGASLDELHTAASEGVAHLPTSLAPELRTALVRGMDPDPQRRWPDMDALLAALEHATRKRVLPFIAMGSALLVVAIAVTFLLSRRGAVASGPRGCDPADVAFGDAWSPAVRAELATQLEARGLTPEQFARIADPFDALRTTWMHTYDDACRAPPDKLPKAQLSCLLAARDNVAALGLVLRRAPGTSLARFDSHGILPRLTSCMSATTALQPVAPIDQRPRVIETLAKSFSLTRAEPLGPAVEALVAEARAIGWAPLVAQVLYVGANQHLRRGEVAAARALLERALPGARAVNDVNLLASIRLGLLEAAITALEHPDAPIQPGKLSSEILQLLDAARATAKAAGNDKFLLASISILEAQALAARAATTRDRRMFDDAVTTIRVARELYADTGDIWRAARGAALEADIVLARGDDRALDDAMYVARYAEESLEKAKLPPLPELAEVLATIAFAHEDYAEAARQFRRAGELVPATEGAEVHGQVVDGDGAAVADATVIAWRGELASDPVNLVTDERAIDGERVRSGRDGAFVIHVPAGGALIAQRQGARSLPTSGPFAAPTLRLAPIAMLPGKAIGSGTHPPQEARVTLVVTPTATWTVRAPLRRNHTFERTAMPASPVVTARSTLGGGTLEVRTPSAGPVVMWKTGPAIEVIARGLLDETARVWLLPRFVPREPPTGAELDTLAVGAASVATGGLRAIGADATATGAAEYRAGDRHAVMTAAPDGPLTICVTPDDRSATPATCRDAETTIGTAEPTPIVVELSPLTNLPRP